MKSKKKKRNDNNRCELAPSFARLCGIVIAVFTTFLFGILFLSSFLQTTEVRIVSADEAYDTVVNRLSEGVETVIYHSDNVLMNIIMLVLFALVVFKLMPIISKLSLKSELILVGILTLVVGTVWVISSNVSPSEDSYIVTNASALAANDDFSFLSDEYFSNFPFQLGYVLFNEWIIRVAHLFTDTEKLIYLEVINVILLAVLYLAVILINHLIFDDERVRHVTVLLLIFCFQPIISASFLYGIIPGFTFSALALLMQILYIKKGKIIFPILSILFLGMAIMLKSNNYIVLIAMLIIGIVNMIMRKHYIKDFVFMAMLITVSMLIQPLVKSVYESRSDIDIGEGIPYISWIAMGFSEAENAPGWYNPYRTVILNDEVDHDRDLMSKKSMDFLSERIDEFNSDSYYRNDFFYKKFVSQWNETSYQSIWNNQVRLQYGPKIGIAELICGNGERFMLRFMDDYAMLVFLGAFVASVACLNKRDFTYYVMPLVVLGGMLYHLLSEAKSQYALPYFILMCGFAAYGICILYDRFINSLDGKEKIKKFFV